MSQKYMSQKYGVKNIKSSKTSSGKVYDMSVGYIALYNHGLNFPLIL